MSTKKFPVPKPSFGRTFFIYSGIKHAGIILIAATLLGLGAPVLADDPVTLPIVVTVQEVLELAVEIRQFKDGSVVNYGADQMAFGKLKSDVAGGPMRGEYYFDIYLHPDSSQRPYRLTQTATALSNGSISIPAGACVVTPWPTDKNGQPYPSGASVGSRGSFVDTKKILYRSGPSGLYAPVAMTYAITSDSNFGATQSVPPDQAGGNYSSSVTFQIELDA